MQKIDDRWVISAGDLVDIVECGHRVRLTHALAAGLLIADASGTTPDTATPDTATPDTATPDTATPDTATPDTATPDTATPDTA
ncbi:hypothetical protein, partial [Frankia sp. AgKG'84/4]|uniref:hypothetical protein n=1 Tax=Frankia sp. AgKG'84/4 TaxID=573490 RepID=UPI002029D37F